MNPARVILLASLVVIACGGREPAATATTATATPPLSASSFSVDVTLSPAATKRLASLSETIIVAGGYYTAPPVREGSPENPSGAVDLGRETVELLKPGRATFSVANADPNDPALADKGNVSVLINVFSGRRTSEDNLLDCGIFEDGVAAAVRQPVRIHCTLIGES